MIVSGVAQGCLVRTGIWSDGDPEPSDAIPADTEDGDDPGDATPDGVSADTDPTIRTGLAQRCPLPSKGNQIFTISPLWTWPAGQTLTTGLETKSRVMITPAVADIDADGGSEIVFVAHSAGLSTLKLEYGAAGRR